MKTFLLALFLLLNFNLAAFAAINLNTATQAELEQIKGIGPVKAKAIMDYRKQHGDFKTINQLDNVHGIGEATVTKLKKQLFVSNDRKLTKNTKTSPTQASASNKLLIVKSIKADRPAKEPNATVNIK
ncbi:MAG: topoisomerase [Methylotenera sp.]|jgi:competence protein ComEA|uniref:ComEA family DNA-binding protein n=1 Tax=Methylotenera mobilis TaxID=359408 RepID=UPI00037B5A14|nr:helix-hairpin-helix domain-containing protein [Methylotenera mobilis]PPC96173.1 MAG: topoisomerase [Methylotenera sp.]PPC97892.1 MAG: topoisomerase [Methylotenera sp.]PPD48959.1 MAG: topoisomerase [Methylotenera sp.]